ncbi:MAG: polysaccharide deacetylase family protein [Chloroflexota bacterium]
MPILMYHYIRELPASTPDRIGYGLSIPPVTFDQQLAYLARAGFHTVTMSQVTSHVLTGAPLPSHSIALTFDDGYSDFYTAALPLLRRYHFTATAYLVVNFLDRPGYMSWQQASQLQHDGIEVGAHTLDHVDLAIQSLATATRETRDSGLILRQRLGVPVQAFAYPSGRYDAAVVRIVAASGFTSAVTTNYGFRYTRAALLTLPRVRVYGGITLPSYIKEVGG